MRQCLKEDLIKEYVKALLREESVDMGGYPGAMEMMSASPYGVSFGSSEDLMKTFIQPFTDVFKTTLGKTKELAVKTRTLLNVSFKTIATTVLPGLNASYTDIFDKEKSSIDKIRSEYKDVYDRTAAALKSGDAAFLAFLASPSLVIGAIAAKQTPKAVKGLLSVVSGGLSDEVYDSIKSKAKAAGRWALGNTPNKSKSDKKIDQKSEGRLREAEELKADITPKKILTSKKLISAAAESPKAKQMARAATEIYRKSLQDVYSEAENVLKKMKSVDDVEKASKKKIPEADAIRKLPPEERQAAEAALVGGLRKTMKEFYVKNLTDHVEGVIAAGVPESAQFVKDYRDTIQKIKAL